MAVKMTGKKKILEAVVTHLNKKIEDPEKQYKVKDFFTNDHVEYDPKTGTWSAYFLNMKDPKILIHAFHDGVDKQDGFVVYKQWSGVKMV